MITFKGEEGLDYGGVARYVLGRNPYCACLAILAYYRIAGFPTVSGQLVLCLRASRCQVCFLQP